MFEEPFKLDSSACQGYRFMPTEGSPKAVMHIVHGLAEHSRRYKPLAEALVADGWVVYTHDHRGHGATSPNPEERGIFAEENGWALAVDDLRKMVAHARVQHPGLPRVMFGHSMGAFFVQDFISGLSAPPHGSVGEDASTLAAAILSGCAGTPAPIAHIGVQVARLERWRLGPRGRSTILRGLTFDAFNKLFKPNRTGFDWLSRDPAEVDKYIQDPACGFDATNQLWLEMLRVGIDLYRPERLQQIPKHLPLYIFAGEKDPVHRQGKGARDMVTALKKAGVKTVDLKLYPDGRHEMLNELNRDEVIADLKKWLGDRGLPS